MPPALRPMLLSQAGARSFRKPGVMPSSSWDLTLPLPLAIAVVLGCMVLAGYVVRANGRGRRRHARRELSRALRAFSLYLADRTSPRDLGRAVKQVGPGTFWTALEAHSLRLGYVRWLKLSRALEHNPYSREERRALRDDSPWRRTLAARRLGLLRSEHSRRALRRALARGPEIVTLAAAMALARDRDRRALRWLLRHPESLAHRSPNALVGALKAFGPAALPDLEAVLQRGLDSQRMERAVIEVLGLGRYRQGRVALESRLAAGDLDLRVAAVRALGRIQAIESSTSLVAALEDEAWQVRAQAARALGRTGATIAIPALAARLTDPSWWVRRHAAYALGDLGHDGLAALRRVVESSRDAYARDMAREVLEGELEVTVAPAHAARPRARRA